MYNLRRYNVQMAPLLEICIDSYESAVAAIRGGADRLELCAALSEGGLTPSVGMLREVKKFIVDNQHSTQLYTMIRCRRGSDFCYSDAETKIMLHDMKLLGENGADGFVFGALTEHGQIDTECCSQIVQEAEARKRPITFHRAFDCTDSGKMQENLELVAFLGFTTVLSSGFEVTALKGLDNLTKMVDIARDINLKTVADLTIMPGSGVSPKNAQVIVQTTGCTAIHASARSTRKQPLHSTALSMGGGTADSEGLLVCDETIVKEIRMQTNF